MPARLLAKRIFTDLLYTIFFLVIPILIVNDTYGIFKDTAKPSIRWTGGTIILILLVYFFLRDFIKKWIDGLAPGLFRCIISTLQKSAILIIINVLIIMSGDVINTFITCIKHVSVSLVTAFLIESIGDCYRQEWNEIKLLKRQDKYRGKYNL